MDTKNILVCGGAGYIGSHMVRLLAESGYHPIVLDDLSTGHAEALHTAGTVEYAVELVHGNILDTPAVTALLRKEQISAVLHFSAKSLVGESVTAPAHYYHNNVVGTLSLLDAMQQAGVQKLIFSSTAAVYGNPICDFITEAHPLAPLNPYGETKRQIEAVLRDYAAAYGLRSVSLRYFNAAGAHHSATIGEAHVQETHLIPNAIKATLGTSPALRIFGKDYETTDGTCIRDYIHVQDLCTAHMQALEYIDSNDGAHAFNLGNGHGFSVLEVLQTLERVSGQAVPFSFASRRAGDPARLIADSSRARTVLGWSPEHFALETILESAWRWHSKQLY